MAEKELEVRPLAPASHRISIHHDTALSVELTNSLNRKYIKCCGCIIALVLIQVVIILVLIFTVFHIKNPVLKINIEKIEGLDRVSNATLRPGMNLTFVAIVSIKNPNVASFKFSNATTILYYGGVVVGEVRNPPGVAKARQTLGMNVTVEVMVDKILDVPRFRSDSNLGALPMSSYTIISGRVKVLKIIKKHVVVQMNCTMTINITSQAIQDQICNKFVSM